MYRLFVFIYIYFRVYTTTLLDQLSGFTKETATRCWTSGFPSSGRIKGLLNRVFGINDDHWFPVNNERMPKEHKQTAASWLPFFISISHIILNFDTNIKLKKYSMKRARATFETIPLYISILRPWGDGVSSAGDQTLGEFTQWFAWSTASLQEQKYCDSLKARGDRTTKILGIAWNVWPVTPAWSGSSSVWPAPKAGVTLSWTVKQGGQAHAATKIGGFRLEASLFCHVPSINLQNQQHSKFSTTSPHDSEAQNEKLIRQGSAAWERAVVLPR